MFVVNLDLESFYILMFWVRLYSTHDFWINFHIVHWNFWWLSSLFEVHCHFFLQISSLISYLNYCVFFPRGDRCTLYPLLWIRGALVVASTCRSWCLVVVSCWFLGNEVLRGLVCLGGPWRAYLKRLSPTPSSHWGCCTLIRCAGTQDPHMQRWVVRTKVIAILLLMYPHVFE